SVSIDSSDTPSSSGGSGGSLVVQKIIEPSIGETNKFLYSKGWKISFTFEGEDYLIDVDDVGADSADLTIESPGKSNSLSLNKPWKVDLDNDGNYDLLIMLSDIRFDKAELILKRIYEPVSATYDSEAGCAGCLVDSNCYPVGSLIGESYCSSEGIASLKDAFESCSENYECSSYSCDEGVCGSKKQFSYFWARFVERIRNLFRLFKF
ncbi:MAG: hypothetical protein KC506_00720, partial [Nanoarchaeota archaeon]|nr:hypothetical protein [Nanoarchaeota archaeon]